MLTIKGVDNLGIKEFSFLGNEWVLYGVDMNGIEYRFIFIPMEAGRYDTHKAQLVLLDRNDATGKGYKLWTTNGRFDYVNINQIGNWTRLVELVCKNKMICLQ